MIDARIRRYLCTTLATGLFLLGGVPGKAPAQESMVDASDPTKVQTFVGAGIEYSAYTSQEYMWEPRFLANLGIGANDQVYLESGYGWLIGDEFYGTESGLTNSRLRWLHNFNVDHDAIGYRGWTSEADVRLAGDLRGTDGLDIVTIGGAPSFGFSPGFSFLLPMNLVSAWYKGFDERAGFGVGAAPLIILASDEMWPGAYLQILPSYYYFFEGELETIGGGSLVVSSGGRLTNTLLWRVTVSQNLDEDLTTYSRPSGRQTLANEWNALFNLAWYF